jgi:hypothetical protein
VLLVLRAHIIDWCELSDKGGCPLSKDIIAKVNK